MDELPSLRINKILKLSLYLKQFNLGGDLRLLHATHSLDLPDDRVLRGLVLGLALHADQLKQINVTYKLPLFSCSRAVFFCSMEP